MEVLPAWCILGIQITEISRQSRSIHNCREGKVMAEERPGHSHTPSTTQEVSLQPEKGWHVSHLFYRFNRGRLQQMSAAERIEGSRVLCELLRPENPDATTRLQTWIVPGHKADFGVVSMDPSPLRVDEIHQRILSGPLGDAIEPAWSFIGLTEVSEYVPTVEQFGKRLVEEGVAEGVLHGRQRSTLMHHAKKACVELDSSLISHHGQTLVFIP